jgi:hypothetical protein
MAANEYVTTAAPLAGTEKSFYAKRTNFAKHYDDKMRITLHDSTPTCEYKG